MVLGDDDALVIGAGGDLDEDAAAGAGEGMMVECHLDGGKFGGAFDAGFYIGRDANMDVLRVKGDAEQEGGETSEAHRLPVCRRRHGKATLVEEDRIGGEISDDRAKGVSERSEEQLDGDREAFAQAANMLLAQFPLAAEDLGGDARRSENVDKILLAQMVLIHEEAQRFEG